MNTSLAVLSYLSRHQDSYVSGQKLASEFGVSRSAIWKAIESLRDEGHLIDAVTNRGYCLIQQESLFDKDKLSSLLPSIPIHLFDTIDSTNRYAKQLASEGCVTPSLVLAHSQSGGRGRLGREFSSPKGGIYLSIILAPPATVSLASLITSAAAVASARAIEEVCSISCGIKWVNDLFLDGRKVGGILTEGVLNVESGTLSSVVVGIGINFSTPQLAYPASLRPIVTSLYETSSLIPEDVDASTLVATLVTTLIGYSAALSDRSFLPEYRSRSIVLGKSIVILSQKKQRKALAIAIDDDAHLVVHAEDGSQEILSSGEISIGLDA
ncbi:MAG TPA: biotin--[acetyl-CoA-carboxylase] ligase [Sphaerochaeta sp.]|nr:biotin--[acetyl-CoA-carboxylase] ligase [Sphaerochaeta sp.]